MKKNILKNRHAEGDVMSLLIKLILGIIILIIIFFILFWNNIWEYIKNLPGGYKYNNKDSVINISKDDKILVNYYKVAVILDGKSLKFCTNGDCNSLRDSKLYFSGVEREGFIYADVNWATDKQVAKVINNRITVDSNLLSGEGVYEKVKEVVPSYSDLKNLDNSIYISGTIYRDKEYVVSGDEKIFGSVFRRMAKDDDSFSQKLTSLEGEDILIVSIEYTFGNIKTTEIQLERVGDEFKVFATYKNSEGKSETRYLDCNKKAWSWQTKRLQIANVRSTLKETLDLNCEW